MSIIRDESLWESGETKINWVKANMPLLRGIEEEFAVSKPFAGLKVALSVHLEAKTAYLCRVMAAGVFAWHGATAEEYHAHTAEVIKIAPNVIIDDGGDLVNLIHNEYPDLIPNVIGGCEETTTGIIRLVAMDKAKQLKFPMMLVNDADCKHLFDNRYGTGQSVWDGINRTTNLIVAGKNVVVAGYGWCGKGVAMRAKGLGASVIVTEINPIKAMEAVMDGFKVMPMVEAAKIGDFFVTVTGCNDVIGEKAFLNMKDGAILSNAGHFDVEVNVAKLKEMAVETGVARNNIQYYKLANGNRINVIAEGRLVNLAAGDGHPAEIMDMSFAIQALSAAYLVKNKDKLKAGEKMTVNVPAEVDKEVAERKLRYWGITIDKLTEEQEKYLGSWEV